MYQKPLKGRLLEKRRNDEREEARYMDDDLHMGEAATQVLVLLFALSIPAKTVASPCCDAIISLDPAKS